MGIDLSDGVLCVYSDRHRYGYGLTLDVVGVAVLVASLIFSSDGVFSYLVTLVYLGLVMVGSYAYL